MTSEFVDLLKQTPCAPDSQEVLLPGEPEWRSKEVREREGIPLPDKTWERIGETASGLGLDWS
jgi:LDH2 family malate/lactate/ureidoglycolate dehydrogenase